MKHPIQEPSILRPDEIEAIRDDLHAGRWAEKDVGLRGDLESFVADMLATIDSKDAEIKRLRDRLEIGYVWKDDGNGNWIKVEDDDGFTETYDGIACRDETIKILDQNVSTLREKVRLLENGVQTRSRWQSFLDAFRKR